MKYEDLVKMSVKDLKARLKDLNTQAQAAAGKDLDALLEEATTITGILDDVKNREKLAGIAKDAEGGADAGTGVLRAGRNIGLSEKAPVRSMGRKAVHCHSAGYADPRGAAHIMNLYGKRTPAKGGTA